MEVPRDMMFRYFERRKGDLENCLHYLENKNFSKLEKVGHQLKGNGITFGHPELSTIGTFLETAAHGHDLSSSLAAVKKLSQWVADHQPN